MENEAHLTDAVNARAGQDGTVSYSASSLVSPTIWNQKIIDAGVKSVAMSQIFYGASFSVAELSTWLNALIDENIMVVKEMEYCSNNPSVQAWNLYLSTGTVEIKGRPCPDACPLKGLMQGPNALQLNCYGSSSIVSTIVTDWPIETFNRADLLAFMSGMPSDYRLYFAYGFSAMSIALPVDSLNIGVLAIKTTDADVLISSDYLLNQP